MQLIQTDYQLHALTEFANQSVRIDHQYASSKPTEARAIFQALQYPNKETAITIKTDVYVRQKHIQNPAKQKVKKTCKFLGEKITQIASNLFE